jgi:hypothetical protein
MPNSIPACARLRCYHAKVGRYHAKVFVGACWRGYNVGADPQPCFYRTMQSARLLIVAIIFPRCSASITEYQGMYFPLLSGPYGRTSRNLVDE